MSEGLQTIIYAICFIIPGFITISTLKKAIPRKEKEYKDSILESFCYSLLNFTI